jgi:hypothetical protein
MSLLNLSDVIFGEPLHTPDMNSRFAQRVQRGSGTNRRLAGSYAQKPAGRSTSSPALLKLALMRAMPWAEPRHHTDMFDSRTRNLEPRFQLDSSARPFNIDEYLCIIMDKYASMKKIRIGDWGDLKKI